MNKNSIWLGILFFYFVVSLKAQVLSHPHILVSNEDRSEILKAIKENEWIHKIYISTVNEINPYVNRHLSDSAWILDRYLLNRAKGKHYTDFISDASGTKLIDFQGNAPVPTVRVSTHKRAPLTSNGTRYKLPTLEELIPNDTAYTMRLYNPETKSFDNVDPQQYIGSINQQINNLAYKAAVLYWLTNEERYARFGADILNQWAKGAYYQHPIKGPGRTGFINIQTLGDEESKPLIIAYDFLYPYMKNKGYNLSIYDSVFEKIASTLAYRGYVVNNWFAAESSTLVAAALSLTDPAKRSYYLDFYLNKDTVKDGCGQLALPSATRKWFTPDGHWREPGGYHNYPVSRLIESAYMLEKNGYKVFEQYPILLKGAYVMTSYSFPDLTTSSYGDTGRPRQDMYSLEIAIKIAKKYKLPILQSLLEVMSLYIEDDSYDRSTSGLTGLLCYESTLKNIQKPMQTDSLWPRTSGLDFAASFLQRNGMNRENGLMCVVQGSTYNHNHSNGMSMELYGKGLVMGVDPGNGPTYEHPLHVEYYTQWAAHNTVVAGGASTSISRFTGGGGTKNIGAITLNAMEPLFKKKAISENYSFVLTDYKEHSTETNQQRLLSLIRLDSIQGYYLDIFYSDNSVSNDYLYHNIGDNVILQDLNGSPLSMTEISSYPHIKLDPPGLRYFDSVKSSGLYTKELVALFNIKEENKYMKMWLPSSNNKIYYTGLSPVVKTTVSPYNKQKSPFVAIRMEQKADKEPFVALYEPLEGTDVGRICSLNAYPFDGKMIAIEVNLVHNRKQLILKGKESSSLKFKKYSFDGTFALIDKEEKKQTWYIGEGKILNCNIFMITLSRSSALCLTLEDNIFSLNCNESCNLTVKDNELWQKLKNKVSSDINCSIISEGIITFKKGNHKIIL